MAAFTTVCQMQLGHVRLYMGNNVEALEDLATIVVGNLWVRYCTHGLECVAVDSAAMLLKGR